MRWRRRVRGSPVPWFLAGLLVLLLGAGTAVMTTLSQQTAERSARQHLTATTDLAAAYIGEQIGSLGSLVANTADRDRILAALRGLAPGALLQGRRSADAALVLDALFQSHRGIDEVLLSDATGRVVAERPAASKPPGREISGLELFRGAQAAGGAYLTGIYRSPGGDAPYVVGAAARVVDPAGDHRLLGVLAATFRLDVFQSFAESFQQSNDARLRIIDQHGQLVADSARPVTGIVDESDPLSRRALARDHGNVRRELHETDELAAFGPVNGSGWAVLADVPTSRALRAGSAQRRAIWAVTGTLALLVLGTTWLLRRTALRRAETEQRAAASLRASEERFRAMYAAAPVGILEETPEGVITAVNAAAARLLGAPAHELVGTHVRAFEEGRPDGPEREGLSERTFRRADGSPLPVVVSTVALRDEHGNPARSLGFLVDLTETRRQQAALAQAHADLLARERDLDVLIETVHAPVLACDEEGRLTRVNLAARELRGLDVPGAGGAALPTLEELELRSPLLHLDGTPLGHDEHPLRRVLREGWLPMMELLVASPEQGRRAVLIHTRRLENAQGEVTGAVAMFHDITDLRAEQRALAGSEERMRRLVQASPIGLCVVRRNGLLQDPNPALRALIGPAEEPLSFLDLFHPRDQRAVALALRASRQENEPVTVDASLSGPSGQDRLVVATLTRLGAPDGEPLVLAQIEDVTERRQAEELLTREALHDPLTGLANRRLLLDRLEHALDRWERDQGRTCGLLFCDVDGFKQVNDALGHDRGDELLRALAARLSAAVRPGDTVARLGGDEFVVLCEDLIDSDALPELAARLEETLTMTLADGHTVTSSIGVALARPGQRPADLLRDADQAMYRAKTLGKARYEIFDEGLRTQAELRARGEATLRHALAHDSFVLQYQPMVDLATGKVTAVEALVRLVAENGRKVPPNEFIPLAEETGQILPIGRWVLDAACDQSARMHEEAGTWLPVSVNISARQAARLDLEESIVRTLAAHDVPPEVLQLEITETALLNAGVSTLRQITRLRERGIRIGLDDFGTGYASLSHLTELPLDFLKIDRSFVQGMLEDSKHAAVVRAVADLADQLGLTCIAEGIETADQLLMLRELTHVEGQGFLLARPMDSDDLPAALSGTSLPALDDPEDGSLL